MDSDDDKKMEDDLREAVAKAFGHLIQSLEQEPSVILEGEEIDDVPDSVIEEIEAWPMPSPDDFDYSQIAEQCTQKKEYCVVGGGAGTGDIINSTGMIRTMEQVLVDLVTDDPAGLCYIDRKIDIQVEMTIIDGEVVWEA